MINEYEMRESYMTRAFLGLTQCINRRTTEPKSIIRKNILRKDEAY